MSRQLNLRDFERAVLNGMREELKDPRLKLTLAITMGSDSVWQRVRHPRVQSSRRSGLGSKANASAISTWSSSRSLEDDARERIAELKAKRPLVETELAALEDAPSIITLHPAMLDHYIRTVDASAAALADHAGAEDDRGSLVGNFRALVHSVRTRDR